MSQELIAHNADLQKLQNEGYELEIVDGYLIMHHVPYVGADMTVKFGMLASPLNLSGMKLLKPQDHVISFLGEYPHYSEGGEITALRHASTDHQIGSYLFNFKFSNKPPGGYPDYYAKFTRYVEIITGPATIIDPKVTATTFRPIIYSENPVFYYEDTNSSRAGVTEISNKLSNQKIAIIGLGGTESYILDLVAKTPVAEIHLFDGDVFCQHNAFRSPGAATIDELNRHPQKVRILHGKVSDIQRIERIALTLLQKYLDHFYYVKRSNWESKIGYELTELSDENFQTDYAITTTDSDFETWLRQIETELKKCKRNGTFPTEKTKYPLTIFSMAEDMLTW